MFRGCSRGNQNSKGHISCYSCHNLIVVKIIRNCWKASSFMPKIIVQASSVAIHLRFGELKESCVPKPEKSVFVKVELGCYFLSLTVSGYPIITIYIQSAAQKVNFRLTLGLSRITRFWWHPEVQNRTIRKPLKKYTNPLKILPILHKQYKFYVLQHRSAVVP